MHVGMVILARRRLTFVNGEKSGRLCFDIWIQEFLCPVKGFVARFGRFLESSNLQVIEVVREGGFTRLEV